MLRPNVFLVGVRGATNSPAAAGRGDLSQVCPQEDGEHLWVLKISSLFWSDGDAFPTLHAGWAWVSARWQRASSGDGPFICVMFPFVQDSWM